MISPADISSFIEKGFIRIDHAFSRNLADEACDILWRETGLDRHDPATWKAPVIRLGEHGEEPFRKIVNAPVLHEAFDQLVGKGRWLRRMSLGSFPVRFPHDGDSGDTGWHVDASFPGADPHDYMTWRINVSSKGRALLMLFLLSDVGDNEAPTRILAGSHHDVAVQLQAAGSRGLSFLELSEKMTDAGRAELSATGEAGTVYLCHPFLVHAAQRHRGTAPKFMAQPPLLPATDFDIYRNQGPFSPVEAAIRMAVGLT